MEFAGKHKFSVKIGSLVSRDRPTKYCVFLKIFTNFLFLFCFAALSFLTRELGGVFVDCSGCNTEYSEFVQSKLFNKNNITIFYSSLIKKIDFRKKVADVYKSFRLLPRKFNLQKYNHPVSFICA